MVATTTGSGCIGLRMILLLLVMVVMLFAGLMVFVTATGGTTGGTVIMTGEGWKCSWFKVELRRLGVAGGILLLLLCHTAATVGRLLQV